MTEHPTWKYIDFSAVIIFLILILLLAIPSKSNATVPDAVIVDHTYWNGAVVGEVVDYNKITGVAIVRVSNPKVFWTKIIEQHISGVSIDKVGLYANFGFLGPVSSTIPWETDFAYAEYNITFDKPAEVSMRVDATFVSGPEAPFFNMAQIILSATPVLPAALSPAVLSDIVDYMKNTQELTEVVDVLFTQGSIIGAAEKLVELAIFEPEVFQPIYEKVGLTFTLDQVKSAFTLWKILDIVRQVSDQVYTYLYGDFSGFVIFKAISLPESGNIDPYITASFSANPQSASPNRSVQFDASGSIAYQDQITSYEWTFGDGTSDTTSSTTVTHVYSVKGSYTAGLTIRSSGGRSSDSQLSITVGDFHLGGVIVTDGTISTSTTWKAADGPYLVKNSLTIPEGVTLTIEPGTKLHLASGVQINVQGTLMANGVTFTGGDGQTPWAGIHFNGAGASGSRLENCTIEHVYASGTSCDYSGTQLGAITIQFASPTITGSTINQSTAKNGIWINYASPVITTSTIAGFSGSGIRIADGDCSYSSPPPSSPSTSSPTVTGNSINGNGTGISIGYQGNGTPHNGTYQGNTITGNNVGINVAYSGNPLISGNTYTNNSDADLIVGGTINGTITWNESGTVVYKTYGITIANGSSLTATSGGTVKLAAGAMITVNGTLKATGVKFTWADGQNAWRGISFNGAGASGSRLENCTIDHADGLGCSCNGNLKLGAIIVEGSSPTISGCTINQCMSQNGIWVNNASPVITSSTIAGFSGSGITMDNAWCNNSISSPIVTNNTISGNGNGILIGGQDSGTYQGNAITGNNNYGLNYSGNSTINANNNNWGDPSGPLDDSDDRATGGLYNPNGNGNKVSDHVNYYPWTGTSITQPSSPTGFSGAPRYASINLTWDANTEPSLNGYKVYYGTSSGSYGTSIIVGKETSYKLTGLSNGTPYFVAISSLNSVGAKSLLALEISATPVNKYAVDLTVTGTGKGNVLFVQGGTACNSNCSVLFDPSTAVTIKANEEQYSLFKGWSGAYIAANGDCLLTMDNDKAITTTFNKDIDHSVLIELPTQKYYSSISDAYLNSSSATEIKTWGTDITENLLLNKSLTVTIKGGFNAGYTSNDGITILHGTIKVRKGKLTVEKVVVQ
jgi:parallel beta-helix repeat protein